MKNEREKSKTILLYETDGLLTKFDAKVVRSFTAPDGKLAVILDRTAFFPEGGGQPSDTGVIITKDGKAHPVTDVRSVDGYVCHYTDEELTPGEAIEGEIDHDIRFSRMQNHGAEHLLCGLIHNRFGYENVGFHLTDEVVTFDVDGPLSDDDIRSIEKLANSIVQKDVPVTISFPSADEAKALSYRSKLDTYEDIRLVTIEGIDVCACCAPHVSSTGQIGAIKILTAMPHRGGTRMTMIAGDLAYRDYAFLHDSNARIMELLSASRDKTAEYVEDLTKRLGAVKEENTTLKRRLSFFVTQNALEHIAKRSDTDASPEFIFTDCLDPVGLRETVNECTKAFDGIVCAFLKDEGGYRYIFGVNEKASKDADLRAFSKEFNEKCNGKGGGSPLMVQGTCATDRESIEKCFGIKA